MTGDGFRPDGADERTGVLADAAAVLAVHVDDGGFCRGCVTTWARLVPFPCTQALWARSVLATFGEADNAAGGGDE